jgi:hypothetical protein
MIFLLIPVVFVLKQYLGCHFRAFRVFRGSLFPINHGRLSSYHFFLPQAHADMVKRVPKVNRVPKMR